MANTWYDLGAEKLLSGVIDFTSDDIQVQAVGTGYTPNYSTDEFEDDLTDTVGTAVSLSSIDVTAGRLTAANTTLSSVSGSDIKYIAIFKNTGAAATSPLLMLIDTATGLTFTPNGADILIVWPTGALGIYSVKPQ